MKLSIVIFSTGFMFTCMLSACTEKLEDNSTPNNLSQEFQDYWYDGNAEISSYQLSQERYGEIRSGTAAMVFVTEQYSTDSRTKPDNPVEDDPTVLKLNFTKNFETGIYPYSIMLSTFFPLQEGDHSLKTSTSTQEWCGQTYMEMINEEQYNIQIHSYFEGESEEDLRMEIVHLEDDLWTLIRIGPERLPTGEFKMIPSFTYMGLMHIKAEEHDCVATLLTEIDKMVYKLNFPKLNRDIEIEFESDFPYRILEWEETYPCGKCPDGETLTSSGKLMETIKVDYWNKNGNGDTIDRYRLGLH